MADDETTTTEQAEATEKARTAARLALGGFLLTTGVGHLSFARQGFRAQVPQFVTRLGPLDTDQVVLASGVAEIAIGAAVLLAPKGPVRRRVGLATAAFLAAVFPGNLAQYQHNRDGVSLMSETARRNRLAFQPVFIGWTLWATGSKKRKA